MGRYFKVRLPVNQHNYYKSIVFSLINSINTISLFIFEMHSILFCFKYSFASNYYKKCQNKIFSLNNLLRCFDIINM